MDIINFLQWLLENKFYAVVCWLFGVGIGWFACWAKLQHKSNLALVEKGKIEIQKSKMDFKLQQANIELDRAKEQIQHLQAQYQAKYDELSNFVHYHNDEMQKAKDIIARLQKDLSRYTDKSNYYQGVYIGDLKY